MKKACIDHKAPSCSAALLRPILCSAPRLDDSRTTPGSWQRLEGLGKLNHLPRTISVLTKVLDSVLWCLNSLWQSFFFLFFSLPSCVTVLLTTQLCTPDHLVTDTGHLRSYRAHIWKTGRFRWPQKSGGSPLRWYITHGWPSQFVQEVQTAALQVFVTPEAAMPTMLKKFSGL